MKAFWNKIKPSKRKIMQLYFALLFNANIQGFFTGKIYANHDPATTTKQFCAPGINCYSCPGAVGACPLGSFQGSFSANRSTLFYVCGTLLLYAILFGRMICGWLCPFGLIQELLYKIKSPKVGKSPVSRILSFFKYVVLVFFVGVVPLMYAFRNQPLPAFCKYICPAGTIEGGLLLLSNKSNESVFFPMLNYLFTWKFMLMISIVVGSVFIFRLFCRFICPLGALYGLFNKFSIFGVKVDKEKCTECNICVAHCKCDIKHVGDQECISCGECIDVCPTKAISRKGSKIFLKANQIPEGLDEEAVKAAKAKQSRTRMITRIISAVVMLGVLIGSICYFWDPEVDIFPDKNTTGTTNPPEELEVGYEVGNLCPSDELQIITPEAVTEEKIDPTKTGKITIINFWGTWCSACVAELPYFDQIATEFADEVEVIAVHTSSLLPTAPGYIANNYADSNITFVADYAGEGNYDSFYSALGGAESGGAYPYTLILDENGVILFKTFASMHYETLLEQVQSALNRPSDPLPPTGYEVGNLCPGDDLKIITPEAITEELLDPTKTGKITIINFWGTWCSACVAELPYFDQIATEYADQVNVIAVHTSSLLPTAPGYIASNYADSKITFVADYAGSGNYDAFYSALGGAESGGAYPYTVILDENGVILFKTFASMHYETLLEQVQKALGG